MATQTALMTEVKRREADKGEAKRIFTDYSEKLERSFYNIRSVIDAANLRGELSQETLIAYLHAFAIFFTDAGWTRKDPTAMSVS